MHNNHLLRRERVSRYLAFPEKPPYIRIVSMAWFNIIMFISVVTNGLAINRPVYKIVLTQKGFAQSVKYDIETPPLREFTFCTWFRMYDLNGDKSIFTYVANSNNRVVRLWLDSGGKHINVSFDKKVMSSSPVEITKDVWRHVCLSYQSDFGAWALYVDSRLVSCQASQVLHGYILPGGGSVIIGYGTDSNGAQNGLEGEIFGVNMILMSTIERNFSLKSNPKYEQKPFRKNKLKGDGRSTDYIILSDLQTGEVNNNFETTGVPPVTTTKSFIRLRTPHSFIEHEVGSDIKSKLAAADPFNKDFFAPMTTEQNIAHNKTWNLERSPHSGKYRISHKNKNEPRRPQVGLPTPSEFEMPPPAPTYAFLDQSMDEYKPPPSESIYKINENRTGHGVGSFGKKHKEEISEVELPPPIETNSKVYGQWTSSRFAGNVLNYLKNLHIRSREQKKVVPQTIPLAKVSDSFPYSSDLKVFKVRPTLYFHRKNVVEKQQFENKRSPQINVQVLEDDLRSSIIKYHAQTLPKNVEISNRGITKPRQEHRFYRNVDRQEESKESSESSESTPRPKILDIPKPTKTVKPASNFSLQNHNLMTILPFLKSLEYFMEDSQSSDSQDVTKSNDVYTRSLSLGNKWHNVKSYSNDYTPREINTGYGDGQNSMDEKIAKVNKKNPSLRIKYKYEDQRLVKYKEDESLLKGRALAREVSNQSDHNKDFISILKYNHGYLPSKQGKVAAKDGRPQKSSTRSVGKGDFHKHVKLGNALNEQPVIGDNVEQNRKSFVGGDERVPDINKYRPFEGDDFELIPGSLGPRVCKNLELYDRVLYVQPDESIDMTHILSPVREKNAAIEFIMQNYKKCSLQESNLRNNVMLFIDWTKTPVKLFGGAYPRTTTDLCGFF